MDDPFRQAADAIREARCAIAVTGAGISVESGIPSFRGADGIWAKYDPEEYASISAYLNDPPKVWRFWCELYQTIKDCKPHPAHYALAELERMNRLEAVITQNVDNLHQDAGSKCVIEYHGNAKWLACLRCRARTPLDLNQYPDSPPYCPCGGLIKPDVVMFGEQIPVQPLLDADRLAQQCDLVLVVGSSAQVFPAAQLPLTAKANGAYIIEANIEPTDFTTTVTDTFLQGRAGQTLPKLVELVRG